MAKQLFFKMPQKMQNMTAHQLQQFFPPEFKIKVSSKGNRVRQPVKYTKKQLMCTIIMNEVQTNSYPSRRTLRKFWYSNVKPVLDKLGWLEQGSDEGAMTRWDACLSEHVAGLMRLGLVTYKDLGIHDISRSKATPKASSYGTGQAVYSYPVTTANYPHILIVTEKDTMYETIASVAQIYGCSVLSAQGQNSLGAMELLVRGMIKAMQKSKKGMRNIILLSVTDFDPAGYYISDALKKQIHTCLNALGYAGQIDVEYHRLGITPDQLDDEAIEKNKYTPKPANMDKWMELTGGINGERKGLELDAFGDTTLREVFVNRLNDFVDKESYDDFIRTGYVKWAFLRQLGNRLDLMYQEFARKHSTRVIVRQFDLSYEAIKGRHLIDSEHHAFFDLSEDPEEDYVMQDADKSYEQDDFDEDEHTDCEGRCFREPEPDEVEEFFNDFFKEYNL